MICLLDLLLFVDVSHYFELGNIIQIFHVIVVNIQEYFPEVSWIAWVCYIARRQRSHRIFVILYFNSKIINQNYICIRTKLISVSWHTKWDKQQEISSNLTVLIININSTVIKIKYRLWTFLPLSSVYNRLVYPEFVTGQYNNFKRYVFLVSVAS
jgi:hypothetical protein